MKTPMQIMTFLGYLFPLFRGIRRLQAGPAATALLLLTCLVCPSVSADTRVRIENDGTLELHDIPPIPADLPDALSRFHDTRSTSFAGWAHDSNSIYVKTRINGANQVHRVSHAGAAREQVSFADEPIGEVSRQPQGNLIAFAMDEGGSGFDQIYLLDPASAETTLLTDGNSLNNRMVWDESGQKLAFRSTRRNGASNDIWITDTASPSQARLVLAVEDGALWKPVEFSRDGSTLLVQYYAGITESRIYLLNIASGELTLLAGDPGNPTSNVASGFSQDEQSVLFITNQRGEAAEIGKVAISGNGPVSYIEKPITWDVTEFRLSPDASRGAFVTNEEGISRLYLFDPATMNYTRIQRIPIGVVSSLEFSPDGKKLGMTLDTARTPSDAFVLGLGSKALAAKRLRRWTYGDIGTRNSSRFVEPFLVHYPAPLLTGEGFISMPAFVYLPRGKGPFPVIIYIHGGPEGQFRPSFNSTIQMWLETLGVAVIAPNVRGSLGYGESYLRMDDGLLREHAVQDIGALLEWIAEQKQFDESRVAVYGASYGGYMSLASAVHFGDRIRAAVDRAGISNFVTYLENTQDYRRDLRRVEYGDERNPEMRKFLEDISPLNNVDRIRTPLLIVQGQNDPVVPASESEQMVKALRARGQPVWYMNALNEGHVYEKKENRDIFQQVTYLFFRQYLLR